MGILLALLTSLAWGASSLLIRMSLQGLRPTTATLVSLAVGFVFTFGLALVAQDWEAFAVPLGVVGWLLLSGLLQFPLGRLFNFASVGLAGVNRATAVVGTAPLFATLFAVLFTGERLSAALLVGTLAVVSGIALIVSAR